MIEPDVTYIRSMCAAQKLFKHVTFTFFVGIAVKVRQLTNKYTLHRFCPDLCNFAEKGPTLSVWCHGHRHM